MKKLLAFFLVVLSAIAFNRCNPYDTVPSSAPATVPVTEVTLEPTTLTLEVGKPGTLTAKVKPENATNQDVTWTSSDEAVATVDATTGEITAVKAGKAKIKVTVKTADGSSVSAECTVKVIPVDTRTFTVGEGENPVKFNMVPVKAGTSQMGDPGSTPQVKLTQDYDIGEYEVYIGEYEVYIGEYEVTQGLWKEVMGNTVRDQRDLVDSSWPLWGEGDAYPMYYVSWDDICDPSTGFLKKLNDKTGMTFTLPTEAQWEYAAAGGEAGYNPDGTRKHKYSGCDDTNINAFVWYKENSERQTHPVGQKWPNELGIYDMSGNVWEWCADAGSSLRFYRGGGWDDPASDCTVSSRLSEHPDCRRIGCLGFRLALLP